MDGNERDQRSDRSAHLRVMTPDGEWMAVERHPSGRTRRAVVESLCESHKDFQVPHLLAVSYVNAQGKEIVLECHTREQEIRPPSAETG